jgi:hypothetical protein
MTKDSAPPLAQKPRWVALFGVLAGGVLLLAACGGSPGSQAGAAVAHLGTSTTTKASSSQAGTTQSGGASGAGAGPVPAGGPGPGGGSKSGMAMADPNASQSQRLAFAHCMQTHGDPDFPEPNAQGVFTGIDPNVPGFQAAQNHCNHILPNDGQPTAAQTAQAIAQALKLSQCMRAHGIANFPDPQVSHENGGVNISIRLGGNGSNLNPNNPQFQAAQRACQGFMPFKGAAKTSANGGPK